VEPNPDAFEELRQKKRRSHLFGHCLSTKPRPEVVTFDAAGLLGGIVNQGRTLTAGNDFDFVQGNNSNLAFIHLNN
jgi:hypothetical protein